MDCTIRDVSAFGAGISLFTDQPLPKEVLLIVSRDSLAYEAEIRWRSRLNLGLFFARSFSLEGVLPPEFSFLQRLWESGDLSAYAHGVRSLSRMTEYKGFRISVVPLEGGFVAFAQHIDSVDAGLNIGERITAGVHQTVDRALAAARLTIDAARV